MSRRSNVYVISSDVMPTFTPNRSGVTFGFAAHEGGHTHFRLSIYNKKFSLLARSRVSIRFTKNGKGRRHVRPCKNFPSFKSLKVIGTDWVYRLPMTFWQTDRREKWQHNIALRVHWLLTRDKTLVYRRHLIVNYLEKNCTQSIYICISRCSKMAEVILFINYQREMYALAHLNLSTASFKCLS